MSHLYLFSHELRSFFRQCTNDHSALACRLMHSAWLDFSLDLRASDHQLRDNRTRIIKLEGKVQHAVIESFQVVPPEGRRVDPFAHVQSTLHWRAHHNVGEAYYPDPGTKHDHIFSGPTRLGLRETNIPSGSVWLPPEKLLFASLAFGSDHFYTRELEDEMERIPKNLYRELVEHRPDKRLRDFPWLGVAYRMAEYLLTRNEPMRETLMPIVQQSCKTVDAKYTLACTSNIWSVLANQTLVQELNYRLFMLQVVSRWPNFRLHYRIILRNGQAEEGWILPWQLNCFNYNTEPFQSLIQLLARHGPEQTIQLHPPPDLNPPAGEPYYYVCRWLLQYGGKIIQYDGQCLFSGYAPVGLQVHLTFYL